MAGIRDEERDYEHLYFVHDHGTATGRVDDGEGAVAAAMIPPYAMK